MGASTAITRLRGGLRCRQATVDGYVFHYYAGGTGEPLVLLHGLADDRTSFLATAARLTRHHEVILPDLTGHGDNSRDPNRDYSVRGHVEAMHGFSPPSASTGSTSAAIRWAATPQRPTRCGTPTNWRSPISSPTRSTGSSADRHRLDLADCGDHATGWMTTSSSRVRA
jgi:hypothetical protein